MSMTPALTSLVHSFVPASRTDKRLEDELVAHSQDILTSHLGHSHDPDIGHLADIIKRQLLQTNPNGSSALKFTNLLSRLLDQPALSRKHASVQFLQTLGASTSRTPPTPALLPSLAPPPPSRPSTSAHASPAPTPSSRSQPKGKSKAELLREYHARRGTPTLPEHLLLRDTLYLLQGISGKYVSFSQQEPNNLEFHDDARYAVSESTKALIVRLAEIGYLYTRVEDYVKTREDAGGVGMIEQSLCHHLQSQLTEYYRLIAVLESQMGVAVEEGDYGSEVNGVPDIRKEETGLTLRRLDVWINDWRLRMRMMSVCVEGAQDVHGGALVNLIHGYTDNGDPFVRKFTDQLLEEVSKPFFSTLHKWLFSGELYDPFNEFFVAMDPDIQYKHPQGGGGGNTPYADDGPTGDEGRDLGDADGGGLKLWETKYQFRKDMLPMFVGEAFGKKIFSTGKSLNFIRYSCHDSDWVATRQKMSNTGGTLKYSDIPGLERSIDAAYSMASLRLFEVFIEKFHLLDHLRALKHYMLLGHGDFAEQLLETLGPSLSRPANTLFRHNLTATLETAIRTSNAQSDPPDVLRRLDARMLEYSHGEIGWDVFTLEYKVDAPIDTVIDPDESMLKYLKLFHHLWRMKRIERALGEGWMRIAGGVTRVFLRVPELEGVWHEIRIYMAEMIHFVRQMQAYCQLEVIECSWKTLMDFVGKREGDLDAMIQAHRQYLDRMVNKVLLLSPKTGKEERVLSEVREAFSTILQFRDSTDNFYNYCLTESARRDRELDASRGVFSGTKLPNHASDTLPGIIARVREFGTSFSDRAQNIVMQLQVHPDLDCRFLGVRLSFSDYYRARKEQQAAAQQQNKP